MINLPEVLVANIAGFLSLIVSILSHSQIRKEKNLGVRLFDKIKVVTLLALIVETLTFVIDGKEGAIITALQYILNGYLFFASTVVAFLWVMFVDYRIFHSVKRVKRIFFCLISGVAVVMVLLVCDLFGLGLLFKIDAQNMYQRGTVTFIPYIFLFVCYVMSLILAILAVKRNYHIWFFPVHYFVLPCLAGTIIQMCFYGLAVGWLCVSLAIQLIQLYIANQIAYEDELSGLFNRKYYRHLVTRLEKKQRNQLIGGIMMDADYFKYINDNYGHSMGDEAVRAIGKILSKVSSDDVLAFRLGGDEFIVLTIGKTSQELKEIVNEINRLLFEYNQNSGKPFKLHLSMGYEVFQSVATSSDDFLHELDQRMYKQKALRDIEKLMQSN